MARGRRRKATGGGPNPRAPLLRAWAIFFGVLLAFHLAVEAGGPRLREAAVLFNADLTALALSLLGMEGRADGALVTSSIFTAEIIFECTAAYVIAMWVAAVLAYPAGLRPKLWGIALGVPALVLLNAVRLVSLFFVGHWWSAAFETVHLLVWQSLLIFLTMLLWLLWAATLVRRDEARPA